MRADNIMTRAMRERIARSKYCFACQAPTPDGGVACTWLGIAVCEGCVGAAKDATEWDAGNRVRKVATLRKLMAVKSEKSVLSAVSAESVQPRSPRDPD